MTYLKYLLLAGAMCAFASCHREDGPLELPEGNPIELSATSDWPKFTKSLIDDITDLKGDGFVAWGDLTTNNNETVSVFDATPVTAIFEDDEVTNWEYSPQQYWQTGTYNFAALLPKSKVYDNISAIITDNGALQLNSGSIILGGENADPIDLMYALSGTIDNTEKEGQPRPDAPVELTFKHLWAQIGFNLQSIEPNGKSIDVTEIKLYGSGLYNSITFTEKTPLTITDVTAADFASITTCLGNFTDQDTPFATFSKPDQNNSNWTVGEEAVALVEELMVFPVELSGEKSVTVEVTYGNSKKITGTINSGTWSSGKKYIYTLQLAANSINFSEPTVTDWTMGENFGVDIQ